MAKLVFHNFWISNDMGFRSDIQGLRAIAVLSVLFWHTFPNLLRGGYVGVDVFFVISGFLISGIIIREIEEQRFFILDFYRRRIRRIFPALSVATLCTLIAGYFCLSPQAYRQEARNVISTMLFVSNFDFWALTGYFGGAAEQKPLLHMWSLAIEEQFYVFFPPLLWLIWLRLGRRKSIIVLAVLTATSIVAAEIIRARSPLGAYFLLQARGFELLLGALLATRVFPLIRQPQFRSIISLLGVASILFTVCFYSPATPFPGVTALLPCLGAVLIIYAGPTTESSLVGRFFSFPLIRFIGDISYSLYLLHWPILVSLRNIYTGDLAIVPSTGAIIASMLAATLSYKFVERPFLQNRQVTLPYIIIGAANIALLVVLALLVYVMHGLPRRFSPQALALFAASEDYNHRREDCHYSGVGTPKPYKENCVFGFDGVRPDIAVWGDSHGAELVVTLGARAKLAGRSVMEITSSACPPAMGFSVPGRPNCPERNRLSLEGLVSDPEIKTVIMVANAYGDESAREIGLTASISALVTAGKHVILIKQLPVMSFNPPVTAGFYFEHKRELSAIGIPSRQFHLESRRYNEFVDSTQTKMNISVFDPAIILCDDKICHAYFENIGVLYFNEGHLSVKGASVVFASIADEIYGMHR